MHGHLRPCQSAPCLAQQASVHEIQLCLSLPVGLCKQSWGTCCVQYHTVRIGGKETKQLTAGLNFKAAQASAVGLVPVVKTMPLMK